MRKLRVDAPRLITRAAVESDVAAVARIHDEGIFGAASGIDPQRTANPRAPAWL